MTDKVSLIDGFVNLLTGLGAANPRTVANSYTIAPSNHDSEAENAYRASTWFGKIVDIPADDATREWRSWLAEKDQIERLEVEESRLDVRGAVWQALVWQRLYGGAVIYMGGLPGRPDEPLLPDSVKTGGLKYLVPLDRHSVTTGQLNTDPMSPQFRKPDHYMITSATAGQVKIHASRMVVFQGRAANSRHRTTDGWGDSVWAVLRDAVTHADSASSVIAALLHEAKIDVVKLPDLMANVAGSDYEQLLLSRFTQVAMMKSVTGITLLDKEDDWSQKPMTWTGLPEVARLLIEIMSGAADIPVVRILGTSAKGLNATGEGDLKQHYDRIKADQTIKIGPRLAQLDDVLIRSALGSRPPEIWYSWNPLWQLTEKERAETNKINAEADKAYAESGLVPTQVLSKATQNRLIESGLYPGIDEAADEFNETMSEPDADDGDDALLEDAAPRSLYVRRDLINVAAVTKWAREQGLTDIADDLHVTICYSRAPLDWFKVGESWESRLTVNAGGPRLMDNFNGKLVLLFSSSRLSWRHRELVGAGASHDYEDYAPHVTICSAAGVDMTKIKPYVGELVFGPEIFEEVKP